MLFDTSMLPIQNENSIVYIYCLHFDCYFLKSEFVLKNLKHNILFRINQWLPAIVWLCSVSSCLLHIFILFLNAAALIAESLFLLFTQPL